jgi:hypothetical protein
MLKQYNNIHTLLEIPYLQPPHPTVRQALITERGEGGFGVQGVGPSGGRNFLKESSFGIEGVPCRHT